MPPVTATPVTSGSLWIKSFHQTVFRNCSDKTVPKCCSYPAYSVFSRRPWCSCQPSGWQCYACIYHAITQLRTASLTRCLTPRQSRWWCQSEVQLNQITSKSLLSYSWHTSPLCAGRGMSKMKSRGLFDSRDKANACFQADLRRASFSPRHDHSPWGTGNVQLNVSSAHNTQLSSFL